MSLTWRHLLKRVEYLGAEEQPQPLNWLGVDPRQTLSTPDISDPIFADFVSVIDIILQFQIAIAKTMKRLYIFKDGEIDKQMDEFEVNAIDKINTLIPNNQAVTANSVTMFAKDMGREIQHTEKSSISRIINTLEQRRSFLLFIAKQADASVVFKTYGVTFIRVVPINVATFMTSNPKPDTKLIPKQTPDDLPPAPADAPPPAASPASAPPPAAAASSSGGGVFIPPPAAASGGGAPVDPGFPAASGGGGAPADPGYPPAAASGGGGGGPVDPPRMTAGDGAANPVDDKDKEKKEKEDKHKGKKDKKDKDGKQGDKHKDGKPDQTTTSSLTLGILGEKIGELDIG